MSIVSERKRSLSGRKLQLRARAARQAETRARIVAATVALHEELGPLQTTITAIAARAGVERLTVYRHFADEESLHRACTQHFFSEHPPPDPASWTATDFAQRVRLGLVELYRYWESIQAMASSLLRDHEIDPERAGAGIVNFTARARDALLPDPATHSANEIVLNAAIGHAVHFYAWRSLVRDQKLTTPQAVALMTSLITTVANQPLAPDGWFGELGSAASRPSSPGHA